MFNFANKQDLGILIFRLLVAILILFHGFGNLLSGYAFIKGVMTQTGLPGTFAYGAFVGEIIAPIMIILGYRVRIAAAMLALTMLVATLLVHTGEIFTLNQFGGWAIELEAFYFFSALGIIFTGGGSYVLSKWSPFNPATAV